MDSSASQMIGSCDFGETCIYPGNGPGAQISLLIRERSAMIRYLGETSVEVRAGFFPQEDCGTVTVLLRAGRHVRKIYATWWDYWAPGGIELFQRMTRQPILAVHFHGDDARRERSFVMENPLITFFDNVIPNISQCSSWTPEKFSRSCRLILASAGDLEGLWEELGVLE